MDLTIEDVYAQIGLATDQHICALERLAAVQSELFRAECALQQKEHQILADNAEDPKALGSNDAARKAAIANLTQSETDIVKDYEHRLITARMEVEVAKLRLDQVKANLRLLELAAKAV